MKKNIVILLLVSFVSFCAYNMCESKSSFSDVLLTISNIEALASGGEGDMGGKITCYSSFNGKDSGSNTVKDCGTCRDVDCVNYWDSGKCKP